MKITVNQFAGMAPKVDPVALADDLAQVADDVGFESGTLAGNSTTSTASTAFSGLPSSVRAIASLASLGVRVAFTHSTASEAVANMLAPSDKWGRIYFLRPSGSKFELRYTAKGLYSASGITVDPTSYTLGMPTPNTAPSVSATHNMAPITDKLVEEARKQHEQKLATALEVARSRLDANIHTGLVARIESTVGAIFTAAQKSTIQGVIDAEVAAAKTAKRAVNFTQAQKDQIYGVIRAAIGAFDPAATTTGVLDELDYTPDKQFTAYVYTFVDAYGHESPPSPPSAVIELPFELPFAVTLGFTAQALPGVNMSGGLRRLYRAAFDGSSTEWQFVADIPLATSSYIDSLPLGQESEALVTGDWSAPPLVEGLAVVNGAFLAAFEDNRVLYSAFMLPHAWPEAARFPLPFKVVAIKATLGGLFIGTQGVPFWASGTDPQSAVPVSLGQNYPCLSPASVVDMGGYIMYATHDGLVAADAGGAQLVSQAYIDRTTWLRDFAPASIRAFAHEGEYYFSVGTAWWVFSTLEGRGLRRVTLGVTSSAIRQVIYDAPRDTTVMLRTDGSALDVVSQVSAAPFMWKSKEFRVNPSKFSTGQVVANSYPVTLTVGNEFGAETYTVNSPAPFRLKAVGYATRWSMTLRGAGDRRVSSASICQQPSELLS